MCALFATATLVAADNVETFQGGRSMSKAAYSPSPRQQVTAHAGLTRALVAGVAKADSWSTHMSHVT